MISLRAHFNKKLISFFTILGLCIPMLLGTCSSYAYAEDQKTEQQLAEERYEQEEKAREVAQIAKHKMAFINELCRMRPMQLRIPTILSSVEFDELDIGKLVGIAGIPLTEFGNAGIIWLSTPIADYTEISRRQGIVRTLVQDESSFERLRKALQLIKKGEDPLIMYWNKESKLHSFIKEKILPAKTKKPKKLSWIGEKQYELTEGMYGKQKDELYSTVPALEVAALSPFFDAAGFTLKAYLSYCVAQMMWRPMAEWKDPYAWVQAFMPTKAKGADIFEKTFEDLWWPISPWDRMKVQDPAKPSTYVVWDYANGEWSKVEKTVNDMGPWHALQVPLNGSAKDKFNFGADYAEYMRRGINDNYKNAAGVALVTTTALRYYFYNWGYFKISNMWRDGKALINKMHDLHASLVDIAKLTRSLEDLQAHVINTPAFNGSHAQKVLNVLMGNKSQASPEFKELIALLDTKTFDNADSFMYSRGRVLRAHILIKKVRSEIVLLLQAVAELDGYCTLARLMKAYEHKENKFVFAEFVNKDTPCMNISSCWEPLAPTKNPVVNDIRLGIDGKPFRMIITGPNGGGKSTFLKSVGHAVTMAQSWGIVPADKAELTLFTEVRTSLDPKEDLSAGISKFTAQKERIGNIGELMKQTTSHNKMLVILDEPYTGTIDDQMADRVHQFGVQAAKVPHAALCIATHVKKPIELARNGSFANYQIEILEPKLGQFVRTFKIKEGPAHWWFNDKPRVTRFVDSIDAASMRKNPGGHVPVTVAQDGKQAGKQVGAQPRVSVRTK